MTIFVIGTAVLALLVITPVVLTGVIWGLRDALAERRHRLQLEQIIRLPYGEDE